MAQSAVKINVFKWDGEWGPFKVNIPCGECALTKDIIVDTMENELSDIPIELDIRPWLNEWWIPLKRGGWHAPIVFVEDKIISQGNALNRGVLTQAVIEAFVETSPIKSTHIFGKETCPHCTRAKGYMEKAGIEYVYHDVVKQPKALYEMLARVKPIVGPKTPITVPQIWIDDNYVGGADQLADIVKLQVEPNPDRGQCSMSPKRKQ